MRSETTRTRDARRKMNPARNARARFNMESFRYADERKSVCTCTCNRALRERAIIHPTSPVSNGSRTVTISTFGAARPIFQAWKMREKRNRELVGCKNTLSPTRLSENPRAHRTIMCASLNADAYERIRARTLERSLKTAVSVPTARSECEI